MPKDNKKQPIKPETEQRAIIRQFEDWKKRQQLPTGATKEDIYLSYRAKLINDNTDKNALSRQLTTVKNYLEKDGKKIIENAILKQATNQ